MRVQNTAALPHSKRLRRFYAPVELPLTSPGCRELVRHLKLHAHPPGGIPRLIMRLIWLLVRWLYSRMGPVLATLAQAVTVWWW